MAVWKVQDDDEIVEMTEEKLRKQLRKGGLSGAELARPEGDSDWKPLHDWPIFKEEVAFEGDAAAVARRRLLQGLLWNLAVFTVMGFAMSWPGWIAWWGFAVAMHAFGVGTQFVKITRGAPANDPRWKHMIRMFGGVALLLFMNIGAAVSSATAGLPMYAFMSAITLVTGALVAWGAIGLALARRLPADEAKAAASTSGAATPAKAAASTDPYLAELEAAFAALEKQAAELGKTDELGNLPGIKKAALSLHKRRLGLLPLCDAAMRARLDKEQDDAIAAEEKADVPMTKDVYRQQALALQQRIDAIDEASAMAARLEARERTLLHQVENLRLQLARAGVEESATPSLAGDIERINRELAAETEVAEVSRGRLGLAAIPKKTM